jgi:uncharacterized protein (DUF1697 family)
MSELRAVLADMGLVGVTTYLQSGNVVFDAGSLDAGALAGSISAKVAARFGVAVHVLLRTTAELGAVVAGSPLDPRTVDPSRSQRATSSRWSAVKSYLSLAGPRLTCRAPTAQPPWLG